MDVQVLWGKFQTMLKDAKDKLSKDVNLFNVNLRTWCIISLKILTDFLVQSFVYFETRQVNSKIYIEKEIRISE